MAVDTTKICVSADDIMAAKTITSDMAMTDAGRISFNPAPNASLG
ncbi:hypothetical protein SDC9_90041 [bioreactor metagenome]|uniref:Uncharacterized protein n=1 Tax=bioreactor metagenome TaxID=1076179 RepID=A0A644ZSK0_9ZZZZ